MDIARGAPISTQADTGPYAGEEENKIAGIRDILPDYGVGFLAACLRHYKGDSEAVTNALLEGALPPALSAMDPHMAQAPAAAAPGVFLSAACRLTHSWTAAAAESQVAMPARRAAAPAG